MKYGLRSSPKVDHFRAFVCITYLYPKRENRKKQEDEAKKCMFIGYSNEFEGYHLHNLETKKLIISRDVIFNEAFKWS